MGLRWKSTKKRPVHLGAYPLEQLERLAAPAGLDRLKPAQALAFDRPDDPASIVNAMGEYMGMLDAVRIGNINGATAVCPDDLTERAEHLKAFGYFGDASMMGACALDPSDRLEQSFRNPDIDRLAHRLQTEQTKTLAAGIDAIMADLRDSLSAPETSIDGHTHVLLFLFAHPRAPRADEPGTGWIGEAQAQRSALRANEGAAVIANYLRSLGYQARSHSEATSDIDLRRVAVRAGLAVVQAEVGDIINPLVPDGFGLAAVTTDFAFATDLPLNPQQNWPLRQAPKTAFARRDFVLSEHRFETLKRVEDTTTFIDEPRVARVPKRTDMFARSIFGDLGKQVQEAAKNGRYITRAPVSYAQRRALGAFVLIQNGDPAPTAAPDTSDPQVNADRVKAAAYWLGADAVGLSRCPDWSYYSHDARGDEITPYHAEAISIIIDQGFETMDGASGDDWISGAQSMRAYLRFSLIGGVLAQHIRALGYGARAHTVLDGEVLQPPLLLLSGLGEVSRIGEVILNPFLGPRLKSGVVTTNMPLAHDAPIDFGLQNFCDSCNKCARECPSGAITAGPKLMFNGYEIWKSDSQRCTTYRITVPGGAMCGRCMKTCPWNLEGLFTEAPFRWAAMNIPAAAPVLAKLDDMAGNGGLNPVKKWWWDLEMFEDGGFRPTTVAVNARDLQTDLDLKYEDQTLAVYPANLAPPPWPYPYAMDREKGIEAYQAMITADAYKLRLAQGDTEGLAHEYTIDGDAPVLPVTISKVEEMAPGLTRYELSDPDGKPLPEWTAGGHIDIVVAPEFLRQYSLAGDPADRSKYVIGVLREDGGKGGSLLLHRIFSEGRKIFISKPINHFPVAETTGKHWLMGGGIGVTPMIAMAHELHAQGRDFALHYSFSKRVGAGFLTELAEVPWKDNIRFYCSEEGTRADLTTLLAAYAPGDHVYTCGPDAYMQSVMDAASAFPEDARHLEYFAVPEAPEYENHPFTIQLARDGRTFDVPEDKSAAEILQTAGFKIDIKCSDGICGVCKCGVVEGEVEHRDFVLSKAQRQDQIITCQSRASAPGGTLVLDL